ncbi:MAG: hypothetical protein IIC51_02515 [Planctomycetes bacterium]|nr:hypothetical protein [Planctomycetota bacterium]
MIDSCPVCRYSLTGLPDEHGCPECGFRYERDAVLIEEHRYTWKYFAAGVAFPICFAAGTWLSSGNFGGLFPASIPILTLLVVALWRARRPKNAGLVVRTSLRIFRRGVVQRQIPLAVIRNAKWSFVTGTIDITGTAGKTIFTVPNRFLQTNRRAKALVSAINEYVRVCSVVGQGR